ncbi:hypothetical protein OVA07_11350 [Novosphingobium sp. SL115]|uniref:hypothetical protein n=1 Tax=Novosphingobium sp. SL115 TaxID=2995150 RepID=UPI00227301F2|nr:hypothetical protein [Novosphingobium sp. SL115]MCY1671603.1 hypothetical protein [Novosphingobium sp. SL115]
MATFLATCALFPALLLTAGCSSPEDREIAERLAKIESTAKAADERSRKALSMAAAGGGQSAPQPPPMIEGENPEGDNETAPVEDVIFNGEVEDGQQSDGDPTVPPPPPIAPGG